MELCCCGNKIEDDLLIMNKIYRENKWKTDKIPLAFPVLLC